MDMTIRVLTLNCWGLPQPYPIGSKDRRIRIQAIAEDVASGNYDLVALQEIWSEDDFELIKQISKAVLPFAHYFHSGYLGSGTCVLSKWRISDALMHRYSLNGFAHHVHRGDWFGGKVVGMARIRIAPDFHLHFYTTHIHAEYDRANDLYLPHRVVQAWELSQFVKMTSHGADVAVVCGDLNLEPGDLGLRVIQLNAKLKDSWIEKLAGEEGVKVDPEGNTCDTPDNIYASQASLESWPNGKRIDYVLFTSRDDMDVSVAKCCVQRKKVPGQDNVDFSDHFGVVSELAISLKAERAPAEEAEEGRREALSLAASLIDEGQSRIRSDRRLFLGAILALVVVFFYTIDIELNYRGLTLLAISARFLLTLFIGFCLWYGLIGLTLEEKALKAAKAGIQIQMDK